jgi:hypothetical protein
VSVEEIGHDKVKQTQPSRPKGKNYFVDSGRDHGLLRKKRLRDGGTTRVSRRPPKLERRSVWAKSS